MKRLLCFCVCLFLVSCRDSRYGDHPPHPASGQVLVNGEPAKGVQVTFHHLGDWGERYIVPTAWTDEEGHYDLATFDSKDGAPEGTIT